LVDIVRIEKVNEVYLKVNAEAGVLMEMSGYFEFDVPGAKFSPAYRNKVWDGKIRLLNVMTRLLYAGLLPYVISFCSDRGYKCEISEDFKPVNAYGAESGYAISKLLKTKFELRDYQNEAFVEALNSERKLLLSPTGSGKSFIIYLLTQWHIAQGRRVVIIVPTTSLVHQMASDFVEYNNDKPMDIHKIMAGAEKDIENKIVITTWQSIYKLKKTWFDSYDVVVGDECHLFKAKSLTSIMTKLEDCKYRYGFTGTLDGTQTHKLVLEGLFGPVKKVISTAELMHKEVLADLRIKGIVLEHTKEIRKLMAGKTYQEEMDFIVGFEPRNKFICNLAKSLKGNTLILFQYVDKHGKVLYPMLQKMNKEVYFVHGGVNASIREDIRKIVENSNDSIILASYGTFSTGINIRNLHNVLFASSGKSRIRNLQSIGRSLRLHESKEVATLYDLVDDLSRGKSKNFALKHFMERIDTYSKEGFSFKLYNVALKG
jgi:superfamily II DNA or RNA helicase